MSELVNGRNYFNEKSLEEMCKRLEAGETIGIYINCIGHTRNAYETARYEEALEKKYGERLQTLNDNWYTEYKLK